MWMCQTCNTKAKHTGMQVMPLSWSSLVKGTRHRGARRGSRGATAEDCGPPSLTEQEALLPVCVYISLTLFPPTALHPILHNKGAWGSGVRWERAHEWMGTNWHVAFCEVSGQPLDRWLPFANEHSGLCVPAFLCARLQNVLSPLQLCAGPEWPVDHRCAVNWETHTSVIKAVGVLVLSQLPPNPLL